jgi:hypothetical protein
MLAAGVTCGASRGGFGTLLRWRRSHPGPADPQARAPAGHCLLRAAILTVCCG